MNSLAFTWILSSLNYFNFNSNLNWSFFSFSFSLDLNSYELVLLDLFMIELWFSLNNDPELYLALFLLAWKLEAFLENLESELFNYATYGGLIDISLLSRLAVEFFLSNYDTLSGD